MSNKKIKEHMNELKVIGHHILPKDLKVGEVYHVPPIMTIKRMDILITSKDKNVVKFRITSDNSNEEKTMDESSILSRFIVKSLKF